MRLDRSIEMPAMQIKREGKTHRVEIAGYPLSVKPESPTHRGAVVDLAPWKLHFIHRVNLPGSTRYYNPPPSVCEDGV